MKKYEFCKAVGKYGLKSLRNNFGVDIQNLDISENFKGQKYVKSEMENDMFLFFKGNILLGMLIGNERKKKFDEFEHNIIDEFESYSDNRLNRNRKNYTELSDYIVRIKKSDMKLLRKFNSCERHKTPRQLLKERLNDYKRSKYDSITNEQIEEMSKRIVVGISRVLFQKMPEEYQKIKWYHLNGYSELLEAFSKDITEYKRLYQSFIDEPRYDREYVERQYKDAKIEIIKYYNTLSDLIK